MVADEYGEIIKKLRERNVPAIVQQIVASARALNRTMNVVIRSHSEMEAALPEKEEVGDVFVGERELANSFTQHVIKKLREESD